MAIQYWVLRNCIVTTYNIPMATTNNVKSVEKLRALRKGAKNSSIMITMSHMLTILHQIKSQNSY